MVRRSRRRATGLVRIEIEGDLLEDDEDSADEATNTGGATSGGPPRADAGEDPSDVKEEQ